MEVILEEVEEEIAVVEMTEGGDGLFNDELEHLNGVVVFFDTKSLLCFTKVFK